jgi:hypothetical protein
MGCARYYYGTTNLYCGKIIDDIKSLPRHHYQRGAQLKGLQCELSLFKYQSRRKSLVICTGASNALAGLMRFVNQAGFMVRILDI